MTTLARRLFTLCSAASLALSVAVGVLWARSYWTTDGLQWLSSSPERAWLVAIKSHRGCFSVGRYSAAAEVPQRTPVAWRLEVANVPTGLSRGEYFRMSGLDRQRRGGRFRSSAGHFRGGAGFYTYSLQEVRYYDGVPGPAVHVWRGHVTFPHWVPLVLSTILPCGSLVRAGRLRRRNARRARGVCPSCGYDLRASPERCPECGMASRPPA